MKKKKILSIALVLTMIVSLALPAGKTALVLGAGGAARGVLFSLGRARAGRLLIYNRSLERAEGLSVHLEDYFPETEIEVVSSPDALKEERVDLVVNATSCGMKKSDPAPLDLNFLKKQQLPMILLLQKSKF